MQQAEWESALDWTFVAHLQRRQHRPGMLDRRYAGRLISRHTTMGAGLDLARRLHRRWQPLDEDQAGQVPIVYATLPAPSPPIFVQTAPAGEEITANHVLPHQVTVLERDVPAPGDRVLTETERTVGPDLVIHSETGAGPAVRGETGADPAVPGKAHTDLVVHNEAHTDLVVHNETHTDLVVHNETHTNLVVHGETHTNLVVHGERHVEKREPIGKEQADRAAVNLVVNPLPTARVDPLLLESPYEALVSEHLPLPPAAGQLPQNSESLTQPGKNRAADRPAAGTQALAVVHPSGADAYPSRSGGLASALPRVQPEPVRTNPSLAYGDQAALPLAEKQVTGAETAVSTRTPPSPAGTGPQGPAWMQSSAPDQDAIPVTKPINIDSLVDKVEQQLHRRLTIQRERRGKG